MFRFKEHSLFITDVKYLCLLVLNLNKDVCNCTDSFTWRLMFVLDYRTEQAQTRSITCVISYTPVRLNEEQMESFSEVCCLSDLCVRACLCVYFSFAVMFLFCIDTSLSTSVSISISLSFSVSIYIYTDYDVKKIINKLLLLLAKKSVRMKCQLMKNECIIQIMKRCTTVLQKY